MENKMQESKFHIAKQNRIIGHWEANTKDTFQKVVATEEKETTKTILELNKNLHSMHQENTKNI